MKILSTFKIVAALFTVACVQSLAAEESADLKLVWADEFNVDGAPNPDFWNYEIGFARNKEAQWYQPDNAYCKDGLLVIEGRKERKKNPNYDPKSKNWTKNRKYAEFTSSSITTRGKKEFLYGRIEVRARIPFGKGAWPAIWSIGAISNAAENAVRWPACGEIDIMEYYRIKGVPTILANAAWSGGKNNSGASVDGNKKSQVAWDSAKIPVAHFQEKDADWLANFHTWRMDWDEKAIKIYLDDELLNEIELDKTVNGDIDSGANPFKRPHFFLLNLAIGGAAGGVTDANAYPMKYEIDYIRVYQKK